MEKKELVKKFKILIEDLLDNYDKYTDEEKVLFKKYNSSTHTGTFGEGYLSVKSAALDFSALFGNDGKTDYTLDLTVAMQNSSSGTLHLGALRNFSVCINHGISQTDQFPADASFGIFSNTDVGLTSTSGTRVQFATDVGWKKTHFLGKPLAVGRDVGYLIPNRKTAARHLHIGNSFGGGTGYLIHRRTESPIGIFGLKGVSSDRIKKIFYPLKL